MTVQIKTLASADENISQHSFLWTQDRDAKAKEILTKIDRKCLKELN